MYQANNIVIARYNKKLILLILVLVSNQLFAAFEIKKYTINNGGDEVVGTRFKLNASIAQVDAGKKLQGVRFQLYPGFWTLSNNGINISNFIFKNGFE